MSGIIQYENSNKYGTIVHNVFPVTSTVSKYARYWLYGALACFSIATFVLLIVWMMLYKGGIALDVESGLFNYHPIFMTLGLFLLPLHGMIVYRFVPKSKLIQKIMHASFMFVGLLISLTGLVIAVVSLAYGKQYHLWSIHSWCGIITILIFIGQFVLAFIAFFLPISQGWKGIIILIHKYGGILLLILPLITILLGVNLFGTTGELQGYPLQGETVIMNIICVCVLILAVLIASTIYGPFKGIIPKVTTSEDPNQYFTIN